ncbi:hypothetical protein ACET3Z_010810 [Daucus carota]
MLRWRDKGDLVAVWSEMKALSPAIGEGETGCSDPVFVWPRDFKGLDGREGRSERVTAGGRLRRNPASYVVSGDGGGSSSTGDRRKSFSGGENKVDERRLVWMVHRGVGRWWFDVGASCSLIGVNGGAGFSEPGYFKGLDGREGRSERVTAGGRLRRNPASYVVSVDGGGSSSTRDGRKSGGENKGEI